MKLADPSMTSDRILNRPNHVVGIYAFFDEGVFSTRQKRIDTAGRALSGFFRQRDDWNIGAIADSPDGFDPLGVRQKQVHEHRVETLLPELNQGVDKAGCPN